MASSHPSDSVPGTAETNREGCCCRILPCILQCGWRRRAGAVGRRSGTAKPPLNRLQPESQYDEDNPACLRLELTERVKEVTNLRNEMERLKKDTDITSGLVTQMQRDMSNKGQTKRGRVRTEAVSDPTKTTTKPTTSTTPKPTTVTTTKPTRVIHVTTKPTTVTTRYPNTVYTPASSDSYKVNKLLVAAIDFGTTYSGWAFSFKHDYEADPTRITSRHWHGGDHASLKAPTTVLIKPDGRTLEGFGYDAENRYAELAAEDAHRKYFYFKHFKMMLYHKLDLTRERTLEDDKGLTLPAMTVFALVIRYLKNDLLKTCLDRLLSDVDEDDIHWVLTVPAIWDDSAKQFMREAAEEGGIQSCNLTIALEPEAASLFCRLMPVERLVGGAKGGGTLGVFQPGLKYMVLDAGGGTVDITVHEVMRGGRLKELHKASGGAWGGTKVDEAFRQMLIKIVGNPVLQIFQNKHTDDFIDMFRVFELKKRDISPDRDANIIIRLSAAFKDVFLEETGEDMKQTIDQTNFSGNMSLTGDKLRASASVFQNLFKEATDSIVKHVRELLKKPAVQGTNAILMVGGFSESPMLQDAIKRNFPRMKIVIPEEAGLVVLKGAVVFGHNPSSIAERVCKYTYGTDNCPEFVNGTHDETKKIEYDGTYHCRQVFDKHVEIGQTVEYGNPQAEQSYTPITADQTSVGFDIYASTSKTPKYVTDYGVKKLGSFSVPIKDMTVPLEQRTIVASFTFSGTEIDVRATEKRTGNVTNIVVDFLG